MESVTMEKIKLRELIEENRKDHREKFEEAHKDFSKKLEENLRSRLEAVREGKRIELHINLVEPRDHTNDYDRALAMLDYEIHDEIVLMEQEFAQLVEDDWGWMREFAGSYTSNTGKRFGKFGM
jgi:hypothetical protein